MLLNNYYNLQLNLAAMAENNNNYNYSMPVSLVGTDGTEYTTAFNYMSSSAQARVCNFFKTFFTPLYKGVVAQTATSGSSDACYGDIVLGEGSTAPTLTDYQIETEIGSDKVSCVSVGRTIDTFKKTITYTKTFQNISGSELTVSEIGCTRGFLPGSSSYNSIPGAMKILVSREVLTSPMVIAADEIFTVSFVYEF